MDSILAAKLVAIPVAFMLAGYGVNASYSAMPILYPEPASISTPMFAQVFHRGAKLVVPTAFAGVAAAGYLTYYLPEERGLWGISTAAIFVTLPYTGLVMMNGINRLIHLSQTSSAAERDKAAQSGEVLRLLKAWGFQNWVRTVLFSAGGFVGLWAAITTA